MTAIPWSMVRALIADLPLDGLEAPAGAQASLDQFQAFATFRLGELGVDVREPHALYVTVAALGLVVECAHNGSDNGVISPDGAVEIQAVCRTLGAALGRLAPVEARS